MTRPCHDECERCAGEGTILETRPLANSNYRLCPCACHQCPTCFGDGLIHAGGTTERPCPVCNGTGRTFHVKQLDAPPERHQAL